MVAALPSKIKKSKEKLSHVITNCDFHHCNSAIGTQFHFDYELMTLGSYRKPKFTFIKGAIWAVR